MASQTDAKQTTEPNVQEMDERTRARYRMMVNLDDEDDAEDVKNTSSTNGPASSAKPKAEQQQPPKATGTSNAKMARQQRKPVTTSRVDASGRPISETKRSALDTNTTSKVDPSISTTTNTLDDERKQAQDEILSVLKQASSVSQLQAKLNQTPQAQAAIGDMVNEKIEELKKIKVQTDAQRNETVEYRKTMLQWRKCKSCGASHAPSPTAPISSAATTASVNKSDKTGKSDKTRKTESKTKDVTAPKLLPLKQCGKCRNVWYCSTVCQKKGYMAHKPICELISLKMRDEPMPELEIDVVDETKEQEWNLIQQGKAKPHSQEAHDAFLLAHKKFNDFFLSWLNRKEMVYSGMFYPSGKVWIVLPNANVEEELPSSAVVAILDLNLGTDVATADTTSTESNVETTRTTAIIDNDQENILPEIDTTKKNMPIDTPPKVETRDETVKVEATEAELKDKHESKMEEVPYEQPKPFGKLEFFDAHFKSVRPDIGVQTYFNFMQLRACLGECGFLSTGRSTLCLSPSQAKGLQLLSGGTNAVIVGPPNSGKSYLANRWADVNGHKKDAVLLADNVSSLANLDNLFAQAEDKPLSQCIFILSDPNLITKKQAKDEGFIIIGLDPL